MPRIPTWVNAFYEYGAGSGHLIVAFPCRPTLTNQPLTLESGIQIRTGTRIHGLFGPKTSAGYENFHPIAPTSLVVAGIYADLQGRMLLCNRSDLTPNYRSTEDKWVYWGWHLLGANELFTVTSAGAGRVVQTDFTFLNGELPPEEAIENDHYWKAFEKGENPSRGANHAHRLRIH